MAPQAGGSVRHWIGDLKAGGDSASEQRSDRYVYCPVHLDCARPGRARRAGTFADGPDAALRFGCTERALKHKLEMIREAWLQGES